MVSTANDSSSIYPLLEESRMGPVGREVRKAIILESQLYIEEDMKMGVSSELSMLGMVIIGCVVFISIILMGVMFVIVKREGSS